MRPFAAMSLVPRIGENNAEIRQGVCDGFNYLGIEINPGANEIDHSIISTRASKVSVAVIPTNEELMIARHTYKK